MVEGVEVLLLLECCRMTESEGMLDPILSRFFIGRTDGGGEDRFLWWFANS